MWKIRIIIWHVVSNENVFMIIILKVMWCDVDYLLIWSVNHNNYTRIKCIIIDVKSVKFKHKLPYSYPLWNCHENVHFKCAHFHGKIIGV